MKCVIRIEDKIIENYNNDYWNINIWLNNIDAVTIDINYHQDIKIEYFTFIVFSIKTTSSACLFYVFAPLFTTRQVIVTMPTDSIHATLEFYTISFLWYTITIFRISINFIFFSLVCASCIQKQKYCSINVYFLLFTIIKEIWIAYLF